MIKRSDDFSIAAASGIYQSSFLAENKTGAEPIYRLEILMNIMAITFKKRAYAGMWFMTAGIFPVLYISWLLFSLGEMPGTFVFVLWFMVVSLLVTGVWGSLLGAGILDSEKVRSDWRAALRGFLVAVAAFLSSSVVIAAWEVSNNEYSSFVRTLILVLGIGSMVVGWLAAIVGMFAGWLLYQRQLSSRDKTGSS
jgi:hypothetical protein